MRCHPTQFLPAGAVAAALFAVSLAAGADTTLTPEILVDLQTVREAVPSPNGERVAYTLEVARTADEEFGSSYRELWVVRSRETPRRFAGSGERIAQPGWSPDGTTLSFLSNRADDGKLTQLFVIPVLGGEAHQLFEHPGSISRYRWSPDGRQVAFVARDPESDEEKEAKEAGRDWKVHDEDYKYSRLWLYDLDSGEAHLWFEQDLDVAALRWTPDGSSVVFQAANTPRIDEEYMYSSIYRVTREGKPEVLAPTAGKLGRMEVSPGGEQLAFLGATGLSDPIAQSLFVVPLTGGTPRNLTAGYEGSAGNLLWLDDDTLLLVASEGTRDVMVRVDPAGGKRTPVEWPDLLIHSLNGRTTLAVTADSARHPSELFLWTPGRAPQRITHHNPVLTGVRLARQESIEWKGPDGLRITGVLTYPLDYVEGRRYPLVLQVHGGPEGVSLDGWTSSSLMPVQLLAARGYVVLEPNYRGSRGRGVAYSQADHDDLGGKEFEDVLAGIEMLAERGLVDPARVGTGGWSYGGYMSAWAATRHTEHFKASVVAAGLTNWIAFAGTTDIPHEMALVHWNSWWFDRPELHWERSPLAYVNQARTAMLIVHGGSDDRVHPEQSLELYTALRIKKVPTQFVVYPREPHGLNERAHRLDFMERVLNWFDTYLAPTTP